MNKIGIVYNNNLDNAITLAKEVQSLFAQKNISSKIFNNENFETDIDMAITIGGDGTLLRTARFYSDYAIPVFGINIGHLGFLAQIRPDDIEDAISKIEHSQFRIEERYMLEATVCEKTMFALNDVVIKGCTFSRTARFKVFINDKFVCEYLADGIIISTPTGSTAYNLSAGGPILYPTLEAATLVPISPHTITARPLVVPSSERITIVPSSTELKLHVNADGQEVIDCYEKIEIKKTNKKAHLMLLNSNDNDFYTVLREKLNWGTAPKP